MNLKSKQFKNTRYPSGEEMKCIAKRTKLVDENISLNRKNHLLWAGLIGLSAVSALSISSCRSNAKALDATRSENVALTQSVTHFQKDALDLSDKNQNLKSYKDFVDSIVPFYPDMVDGRTKAEEKEIEKRNIAAQKKYNDACKTLEINPAELMRLKERE